MESFPLYNGEITLEYNDGNHTYRVVHANGRKFKVPSVTRITSIIDKSGPLINWAINNTLDFVRAGIAPGVEHAESYLEEIYAQAKKESQRKKSEAAQRGTIVHNILSQENGIDESIVVDQSVQSRVERAKQWLKENNVEFSSIERPIYSRRHRYSGRFDGVARINGLQTLLDWKTGKGVYPEFRLQTAAYVKAYEEETGEVIDQRIILHLGEEECKPYYFPRDTLRKDFAAFLGAHKLFTQLQSIEKQLKGKK